MSENRYIKVLDCNAADLHRDSHVWEFEEEGERFFCFGTPDAPDIPGESRLTEVEWERLHRAMRNWRESESALPQSARFVVEGILADRLAATLERL